jgi:homoserine kinase type II
MAVYTALTRDDVEQFIRPFGIGPLIDFEGVAAGIENTNYFVDTDLSDLPNEFSTEITGHYVLTIFEQLNNQSLAFYVELTTQLNLRGHPVPCPLQDADGLAIKSIQGKPALLIPKIIGQHPTTPNETQCQAIGQAIGAIHNATLASKLTHQSNRNRQWLQQCADEITSLLPPDEQPLLNELARFEQQIAAVSNKMPQGIIHGDLFRDNAIFSGDQLLAIIDFNSAGSDYLLMDLAVIANDWCSEPNGSLNTERLNALIRGYQLERLISAHEKQCWNDFLRAAAYRFWLSRRFDQLQSTKQPSSVLAEPKDPLQYKQILLQRIQSPSSIN